MSETLRVTSPAVAEAPSELQALARDHVENMIVIEPATQESQRDRTAIDDHTPFAQPITSAGGDGVAHPVAGRTQGLAHPPFGKFAPRQLVQ